MSWRVLAPGPRSGVLAGAALLAALLAGPGCLDPMPTFGALCAGDDDCGALGVCFDGACVPNDFAGLDVDEGDDDGGPAADAGRRDGGGEDDAGTPEPDAGEVDAGADAGDLDAGSDAGDLDAGDDDDAGPIDAGADAGPSAVCGDGVVEGSEQCDWGDGRNGVGDVLCSGACAFDLTSPRRVNLDPLGGQLSGLTSAAIISADGRYVVYDTDSLDVTNAATEGRDPIRRLALLDLETGSTVVINAGSNQSASNPSISADGDVVAFVSNATNLTADADSNNTVDVYAFRRSTGAITLVSKSPSTGAAANGASFHPWLDAAGTTVVFVSNATDLVAGTPARFEIFKVDLDAPAAIIHVSTSETGGLLNEHSENPVISGDGSTVAFYMYASNFLGSDGNATPDTVFIDEQQRGYASRPSGDGDANGPSYVESISHDGNLITYRTLAPNLSGGTIQQSVLFDKTTSEIHRIAWSAGQAPNALSTGSFVSGDGRYVAFSSSATNLVTNDSSTTDIYVRRMEGFSSAALPTRVTSYNDGVGPPSMPRDGAVILFTSSATDIVPNDSNAFHDVFLVANPLHP